MILYMIKDWLENQFLKTELRSDEKSTGYYTYEQL